MTESADYDPGPWRGHDFGKARAAYDTHAGRSYSDAKAVGKTASDLLPASLSTNSTSPLVIAVDVTGSMSEWPATIFSKLPYLEHEAKDYLGADAEICWAAVGDAQKGDRYPVQARPFTKGTKLAKALEELVIEGGGGGGGEETYELLALYLARNVSMPRAIRPICIFIGDERPYSVVPPDLAQRFAHVDLGSRMTTADVFAELKQRFDVFLIRKPYGTTYGDQMSADDKAMHAAWAKLLGNDHIAYLPEAGRVVDVIFGILAGQVGRYDDFKNEIEGRQDPGQVKTVYKSLATIHQLKPADRKALPVGVSQLHRPSEGDEADALL